MKDYLKILKMVIPVNNLVLDDINLTVKEDKKEIFKELIVKYLIKQIIDEE